MEKKLLKVGKIVNTQGIKGELRVYPLTDYKERFEELEWVYIEGIDNQKFHIENIKYKNNLAILKFENIDNINQAEEYKGKYLLIDREYARKLPEDTYFIVDLIGVEIHTMQGEKIGVLDNIIQSGGNDIYEIISVKDDRKKFLIPAVAEFVKKVDIKNKRIYVDLIEGLIE
ncbi:MAG: 16S rRNA processing protein RimM [Alkaliphilus sp.]|nr:16S rRNA processing protein RimM [Alkaliphilus sp.]